MFHLHAHKGIPFKNLHPSKCHILLIQSSQNNLSSAFFFSPAAIAGSFVILQEDVISNAQNHFRWELNSNPGCLRLLCGSKLDIPLYKSRSRRVQVLFFRGNPPNCFFFPPNLINSSFFAICNDTEWEKYPFLFSLTPNKLEADVWGGALSSCFCVRWK